MSAKVSSPNEVIRDSVYPTRRARYVGQFRASGIDKKSVDGETPVRMVNYSDVYSSVSKSLTAIGEYMETTASAAKAAEHQLEVGDVLITPSSETAEDIGHAAIVAEPLPRTVYSYHLLRFRPNNALVPAFAKHVFNAAAIRDQLSFAAKGTTRQILTRADFDDVLIPIPTVPEQERISAFLDEQTARIDALIAEKGALIARLATVRESYAFALTTQSKLLSDVVAREEPWFASLPRHWAVPKLGYIADVGNGSTPRRDVSAYWEGGTVPWVTSTAIHSETIEATGECITEAALTECHLRMVRPGSTIIGLIGQGPTRGMAARLAIPATLSQNVAFVSARPNSGVSDEYLTVVLTGLYSSMRFLSDGGGGAHGAMNCDQLRALRVPKPPPSEQVAIVEEFRRRETGLKALRMHVKNHLDCLREYRSSLISAAVTGQLDLGSYKEAA